MFGIFSLLGWILGIAEWLLIIYFIMMIFIPQNKYVLLASKYVEIVLAPVRKTLFRLFPKLADVKIDLSPIALLLLIWVAQQLVRSLSRIP